MFLDQIKDLKNEVEKHRANATAFVKLAEEEDRPNTDEENAQIDEIVEKTIPNLNAKIARLEKLHAFSEEADHSRDESNVSTGGVQQKFTVPATAKRHGKLKAFQNDEDAYATGQFLISQLSPNENARDHARQWCNDHGIQAALSTTDNSKGGVLVPEQMENAIIDLREQRGIFRQEARVVPTMQDVLNIPRTVSDITAYYVGENNEVTASDQTFDNVRVVCDKLGALTKVSNELIADAVISIADLITQKIAYVFADKEDEAGFNGNGTLDYGGTVGLKNAIAAGGKVTAATGNTAFSTLDLADFESMVGKLPRWAERNAKWYISKAGYAASMMRLIDAAGGNTISTLEGGPSMRSFLGYPVVITQVMNSTLTAQTSTDGLCYFGDLALSATMASRQGVEVMASRERYMEYGQVGIVGFERFGITVHEKGDDSNAGGMIMLSTPGS